MDNYDPAVLEAVRGAMMEGGDLTDQIRRAIANVRDLPNYRNFVKLLVDRAVASIVYSLRHQSNTRVKKSNPPRSSSLCPEVLGVYDGIYDNMYIGGHRLGNILGSELPTLAADERRIGKGHERNALFLEYLSRKVPADRSVRDCVREEDAKKQLDRISRELGLA